MRRDRDRSGGTARAARTPLLARCVVMTALLAGGSPAFALHWPWRHRAPPAAAAAAVHIVAVSAEPPVQIAQYRDGDALLIDLTQVGGAGSAALAPLGAGWPVRLEFRVQAGRIGRLEVRAAQRVVFLVPAHAGALVLKLDPGVYGPDTGRITLRWSAADGSAR